MDPRELDIGLWRVSNQETVHDPIRDRLRHSVAKQALDLHTRGVVGVWAGLGRVAIETIRQRRLTNLVKRGWTSSDDICCPSIDEPFQFRSSILD